VIAEECVYSTWTHFQLQRKVDEMTRHIGIDLHRNCFTACTRAENGRGYVREWRMEDLDRFVRSLRQTDELAVETTGNTRLFCEKVAEHVAKVVVVNSAQFKLISHSVKKTDANDAELLSRYLSQGLLPEVRMKDKTHAQLASLTQTRDKLVKLRTILKNKINNMLSAHGINLQREALSSDRQLQSVLELPFAPMETIELKVLVGQIRSLNESIHTLEDAIQKEGEKLTGHKNLTSIKGIGPTSASILLSVIGDVDDFADEGKLASYFGIVPRVHNSNETERSGRITKRGSKLGRTALVQCSLVAKRYSRYLSDYYERIKSRRGGGKAIIALARKFLGIIYQTLKNNWIFEDFPNFVLAK